MYSRYIGEDNNYSLPCHHQPVIFLVELFLLLISTRMPCIFDEVNYASLSLFKLQQVYTTYYLCCDLSHGYSLSITII